MKSGPDFKTAWMTHHAEREAADKYVGLTHKNFRLAKRHAYRSAKAYIDAINADQKRFMEEVKNIVGDKPGCFDLYIEQFFAPLASIGEDFSKLITCIHEGMTEKQYLAQSPDAFLGSKRKPVKQADGDDMPLPPPPLDDMDTDQQLEHWKVRARAAERELKSLRSRVNELSRESAKLRRQNQKLHRLIKTADA